ncbi:MAG: hypothetical protein MHM6MM_000053 [Cercozoa sp. M6MM]
MGWHDKSGPVQVLFDNGPHSGRIEESDNVCLRALHWWVLPQARLDHLLMSLILASNIYLVLQRVQSNLRRHGQLSFASYVTLLQRSAVWPLCWMLYLTFGFAYGVDWDDVSPGAKFRQGIVFAVLLSLVGMVSGIFEVGAPLLFLSRSASRKWTLRSFWIGGVVGCLHACSIMAAIFLAEVPRRDANDNNSNGSLVPLKSVVALVVIGVFQLALAVFHICLVLRCLYLMRNRHRLSEAPRVSVLPFSLLNAVCYICFGICNLLVLKQSETSACINTLTLLVYFSAWPTTFYAMLTRDAAYWTSLLSPTSIQKGDLLQRWQSESTQDPLGGSLWDHDIKKVNDADSDVSDIDSAYSTEKSIHSLSGGEDTVSTVVAKLRSGMSLLIPSTSLTPVRIISQDKVMRIDIELCEYYGQRVVTKWFCLRDGLSPTMFADIPREAKVLARLRHHHCVEFRGVTINLPRVGLVMEYASHGSLQEILHDPDTHAWQHTTPMQVAKQVARGLAYLHNANVVHGDIKSPNVLLTGSKWCAKVADFGESLFCADTLQENRHTGRVRGTTAWIAPELFDGTPPSFASDMYSFGVLLWELLTFRFPFVYTTRPLPVALAETPLLQGSPTRVMQETKVESAAAACRLISEEGRRPPIPIDAPVELQQLLRRCFDADPETRPSWEEVDRVLKSEAVARLRQPVLPLTRFDDSRVQLEVQQSTNFVFAV